MSSSAEPLRVIVADDEALARRMLLALLRTEPGLTVVAECTNGPETIAAVRAHAPDVLFLDVRMPGCTGLEVLDAVGLEAARAVVFVTAFDDYAVAAFDHHALDYVLKPVDDERFRDTVRRVRERLREHRSALLAEAAFHGLRQAIRPEHSPRDEAFLTRFVVRSAKSLAFVETADVDWIEADDDYVRLHTGPKTHLVRSTLNALERQLDPTVFVRIHRSAIVNLDSIVHLEPISHGEFEVVLKHGGRTKVSRTFRSQLEKRLGQAL